MEIRFKDGKPLMVGGGLIAGSQSCCCENPPPPACWCPDYCQYKIEVVSPEECAVSTSYQCNNSDASRFTEPSLIQSAFDAFDGEIDCPGEAGGIGGAVPCGNYSGAFMSNQFMESYGLGARANSIIRKRSPVGTNTSGAGGEVNYGVLVYCSLMGGGGNLTPQIFLQLDLRVRLFNTDASLGELFFYYRVARKIVRVDKEECELAGDRKCLYLNDTNRRTANFQTPLEFTMSIETTSFGNYEEDSLSGREFGPYQDVLDSLIDVGFEATFRITSRPSCEIRDCSCSQSLTGILLQLNGETFTVGNEPNPSRGSEQQVWSYTDSASNPVIEYTVWDAFFLEEQYYIRAEIFCDSEQQADGNVGPFEKDAWYLIAYNDCYEWEDGVIVATTRNTYVGEYQCYEHCDKFLPSGTPLQMYLVSSVTTPGLNSCSPPPATPIIIDLADCP